MLQKIIEISIKERFVVCAVVMVLIVLGVYSLRSIPLDALPDLSDTQVIVYSTWDVSADIIEDQLTYPLVTSLLSLPKVRDIRASSVFGASWVYVIFEDQVDIYWARSRVSEALDTIMNRLPQEAQVSLGPDATGIGWIYQYVLRDRHQQLSLPELRSLQDNYLKLHLQALDGVSEVASYGGYTEQLEVQVHPEALQLHGITLTQVLRAVRESHGERGARAIEYSGARHMIRLQGYVRHREDLENSVVMTTKDKIPVLIKDIAHVTLSPAPRHGAGDFNGLGEAVGGIVVMRYGGDVYGITSSITESLERLQAGLPKGVEVIETYNRNHLITRSIEGLTWKLLVELLVVAIVIFVFLLHVPSAIVPIICLPTAIIISMVLLSLFNVTLNIMTLGGIAIAMGAMVDAALVMIENCHKHFARHPQDLSTTARRQMICTAMKEVAPSSFYSLMIIAISFLPVFFLERQEGRLFQPLVYSKTFAMLAASFLSITFVPALCAIFLTKGGVLSNKNSTSTRSVSTEDSHVITRMLNAVYEPALVHVLQHKKKVVCLSVLMVFMTVPVFLQLGSEFIPPFNEGTILYMPTTAPGISIAEASKVLQEQDRVLKSFPEVLSVHGKAGRAQTATDPAPLSMFETIVVLKDQKQWRERERWYSFLPAPLQIPFEFFQPKYMSYKELIAEMDQKMQFPGIINAWTQPIRGRIDMLTTGVRTPVGIRISGPDLTEIARIAKFLEQGLSAVEGTRSVYAERLAEGYYIDVHFSRERLARHGLTMHAAQTQLSAAISGQKLGEIVMQRQRYPLVVRYERGFRDRKEAIERAYLDTPLGYAITVSDVATVKSVQAPAMIKNDNGLLSAYVYLDLSTANIGDYVQRVQKRLNKMTNLPSGYSLAIIGQYESMQRVNQTLLVVVPLVFLLIMMMIYLNLRCIVKTLIVVLAVPFSLIGAVCLVYFLDYQLSIAVWVGMVALIGVDIETAMFMLLYLDLSYNKMKKDGTLKTYDDLKKAIYCGAAGRIRPKFMTVSTTLLALLPILLASSADSGADVIKRMVAPMMGGIVTSFLLELLVYPAIYAIWKEKKVRSLSKQV